MASGLVPKTNMIFLRVVCVVTLLFSGVICGWVRVWVFEATDEPSERVHRGLVQLVPGALSWRINSVHQPSARIQCINPAPQSSAPTRWFRMPEDAGLSVELCRFSESLV